MRSIYLDIIYNYGALIACILSLFLLVFKPRTEKYTHYVSLSLVALISIISLEFYPFQIVSFPLNSVIPIGIIVLFIPKNRINKHPIIPNTMIIIFSIYLLLGLVCLSASANTRGDGAALLGMFIVPNSLMILTAIFCTDSRSSSLFIICKLITAVAGLTLIYYSTNGFSDGSFDGVDVRLRRYSAVIICITLLAKSILIYRQKVKEVKYLYATNQK